MGAPCPDFGAWDTLTPYAHALVIPTAAERTASCSVHAAKAVAESAAVTPLFSRPLQKGGIAISGVAWRVLYQGMGLLVPQNAQKNVGLQPQRPAFSAADILLSIRLTLPNPRPFSLFPIPYSLMPNPCSLCCPIMSTVNTWRRDGHSLLPRAAEAATHFCCFHTNRHPAAKQPTNLGDLIEIPWSSRVAAPHEAGAAR